VVIVPVANDDQLDRLSNVYTDLREIVQGRWAERVPVDA
jgi:hypothetical protein